MDYSTILIERVGLVERITLNRPEKRNALSVLLQDELIDAVHAAERGNEVRVIVIRGRQGGSGRTRRAVRVIS